MDLMSILGAGEGRRMFLIPEFLEEPPENVEPDPSKLVTLLEMGFPSPRAK